MKIKTKHAKQNKQTEQRFDVQGEIYGLVIWHNRVILREIDEKTLRDGSFFMRKSSRDWKRRKDK